MQKVELMAVGETESKQVITHTATAEPLEADLSVVAPNRRLSLTSFDQRGRPSNLQFWLSQVYRLSPGGSHYCVTAFSGEDVDKTAMQSFYLSQSSGVWRVSPYSLFDPETIETTHMGKGYNINSVAVVPEIQKALAIATDSQKTIRTVPNALEIFYAASKKYPDGGDPDFFDLFYNNIGRPQGDRNLTEIDYVRMVEPRGSYLDAEFYHRNKIPPESIRFFFKGDPKRPVFENLVDSWSFRSGLYKRVTHDVIASDNNQIDYLLCNDPEGNAWVGAVFDKNGTLTPLGITQYWIHPGDLITSRFEHQTYHGKDDKDALFGYGTKRTRRKGYADMAPGYLSKIPMLQDYQASKDNR